MRRAERVERGDEHGQGRLWRFTWRSRLPYELSFESRTTRREPPYLIEGTATGGPRPHLIGVTETSGASQARALLALVLRAVAVRDEQRLTGRSPR